MSSEDSPDDKQVQADQFVDEWDKPGAGCRPCCSAPHGGRGVLTAILSTIAWIFTCMTLNSCQFMRVNFLYCHPTPIPNATYGTCGDCHCIAGEEECPTDPAMIPPTHFPEDYLQQLELMQPTNPFKMLCNPYNHSGSCGDGHCGECTEPNQNQAQVDLWETAACGHKYNLANLTEDSCPTQYEMITYNSLDKLNADGAQHTHWGACGPCSTSQDLAVYMRNPDLTLKGQECGVRGLFDPNDGINCFMEAGYTRECSEIWMYNVFQTRDKCFDVCVDFTFFGDGKNAGPPPECRIANCLLCDEQMSGPTFQEVAARSRRRSGLLSKIARPCNVILIVNHTHPCDFVKEQQGNTTVSNTTAGTTRRHKKRRQLEIDGRGVVRALESAPPPPEFTSRSMAYVPNPNNPNELMKYSTVNGPNPNKPDPMIPYKWYAPQYPEQCFYINEVLGLTSYSGKESNNWLFGDTFLSSDEKLLTSQYSTCISYEFRNVLEGFWANMSEIMGGSYRAAKAFAIVAVTLGGLTLVFVWTTTCIAYPTRFWLGVFAIYLLCGLFTLLTFLFLNSDVCNGPNAEGCSLESGAAAAIVGGIFWFIAAYFSFTTGPFKPEQQTAACCCCPSTVRDTGADSSAYSPVPTKEPRRVEVSVSETVHSDGTVVVEKTTSYPNGAKEVEMTTTTRTEE